MSASAPHSPAPHCNAETDVTASPSQPSPSKLLQLHRLGTDRASSVPPRRLSSPLKNVSQIRPRLNQYYTLDHAVSLFKSAKNIIILTGAGISTSLGVPDFRSTDGIYNLLKDSVYDDPQELFHIDNFKADPAEFFKQAAKVFPKMQGLVPASGHAGTSKAATEPLVPRYSSTHAFVAMLQSKGKLLTNYTQNIDGLEIAAGVSPSRLIQVHGTLATATCMSCGKQTTARKYMPVVRAGGIPFCKCSLVKDNDKTNQHGRTVKKKRKRHEFEDSESELEDSTTSFPKGLLKPDMTFFGEHISYSYAPRLDTDKRKADLLVIVGTSLKVAPVNDMLLAIPPTVPQIWISKDRCQRQGVKVDIELLGECDLILEEIARRAGWTAALEEKMWENPKSSGIREPAAKSQKVCSKSKLENMPAIKAEGSLQIRPKAEAVADSIAQNSEIKSRCHNAENSQARAETKKKTVSGIGGGSKPDTNRTDQKRQPRESKVIVELEEGTRSRWYIRRAK
ncbi:hypothetical protein A1O3_05725 [Capronia epimyces CBS 606.96]|uniref:Deacetylase sirtuin-type domain-containing protein n=1 Tax=Capronia epimyces CBS 606.96 TaxID=1182542 RepID=W9Y5Z0_9EURO|nr:uncharacterized protein A1O3_05725 [Capronia epimyces CBS 606.96]EXJ85050.1 hypothetical protein A1O3_05725 [Capronia epimyces CBS 606.96]